MGWEIKILIVFALFVMLFLLNFYRDPKRTIPKGNNIVSPADGRVISILKTGKDVKIGKGLLGNIKILTKDIGNECYVVSIFMSPIDVHINRAPIEGIIKSVKHTKGKFFRAYNFEKSLENEKNEIIIKKDRMKVKVIQIAGFLARRIKCYVKKNQKVNKGQKIGMIALSSQTTIIVPTGVDLKAKINQHVKAGSTIIANLR